MKVFKKVHIFNSRRDIALYLTQYFYFFLQNSFKLNRAINLAIESTPDLVEFFHKISEIQEFHLWDPVKIFNTKSIVQITEEHVTNDYCRQKSDLYHHLIERIPVSDDQYHGFASGHEFDHLNQIIEFYEEKISLSLKKGLDEYPVFDLMIQNLNSTESLFLDLIQLREEDAFIKSKKSPNLTTNSHILFLNSKINHFSKQCIWTGFGSQQADFVQNIIENELKNIPFSKNNKDSSQEWVFLLDAEAANKLSHQYQFIHHKNSVELIA